MLYSAGSGVSSMQVVLSVLRSRSLYFVHVSIGEYPGTCVQGER